MLEIKLVCICICILKWSDKAILLIRYFCTNVSVALYNGEAVATSGSSRIKVGEIKW